MTDIQIKLETLKNLILEAATYNKVVEKMENEYVELRHVVLKEFTPNNALPICLVTCSTLSQVRNYFQKKSGKYQERRELIETEFNNCLGQENEQIDFESALEEIEQRNPHILPDDIKTKGKQMAGTYYILYCIENSLRIFIDTKFKERHGDDYFSKILVPLAITKSIQNRKMNEQKNAWLSIRGNSELFYMDFKDLGDLIINNWPDFKSYFPDQAWIKTKIEELGNCRNLIAHNSYIGDHERNVINVNYMSILRQINR